MSLVREPCARPPDPAAAGMLTLDHLARAVEALDRGELPDAAARAHVVATWRRWRSGLPWDWAAGRAGPLATAERNAALRRAGALLASPGETPWTIAGRLRSALVRVRDRRAASMPPEIRDALADALAAGGGRVLKRDSLYRLLSAWKADEGESDGGAVA